VHDALFGFRYNYIGQRKDEMSSADEILNQFNRIFENSHYPIKDYVRAQQDNLTSISDSASKLPVRENEDE
jgi:hypothetical protein